MSTPATYAQPIDRPPPQAQAGPYGGFWLRLAAHFVDGILIGLMSLVVIVVFALALGAEQAASSALPSLLILVLGQGYHAYFVSSPKMATPGKRLCGLYVTDLEGRRLGFGHALLRNVAAALSYLTLYIGFMMAGFTERKQALHDKIAGTLVHRQPESGAGGVVIAVVIGVFFMVALTGILAAIAIPAYQDYIVRAKVAGVLAEVAPVKTQVMEYAVKNQAWPTDWDQLGAGNPVERFSPNTRSIATNVFLAEDGVIVVDLRIRNKEGQLQLAPSPEGAWTCSAAGDIQRYVPMACK